MHVEMRMLRALVMVEAHGSVGGAAQALAFSPAAVSAHLRALEKACGTRLVERTGAGTRLTSAGRRAVPIARLILVAAQELQRLEASAQSGPAVPGPQGRRPAGDVRATARHDAAGSNGPVANTRKRGTSQEQC
ncbi:LysR family transcriptional regulator [Aeromicrobium sp. CnD17-E]|uniref:helix-turn-helix domain-containing protein n=1 Tax=Aeromicrobium sp. CnD17-E TaxID=2954487 RepID=UPI002096F126|nr:LysR family transcriptional regulator [Aeromicrobium sp. CnD17-E]MCO7238140.1 LysR family transcriptional regulator [Aeromicrobium sp. CnD17-E]